MNSNELFWNYFRPIAEAIVEPLGGSVRQSDGERMEKLLSASVSSKIYPAVFVMRPSYKLFDNGAEQFYLTYNVVFYVFSKSKPADTASIDAAFDEAEAIALQLLHQLRHDHLTTDQVDFDYNSSALEPVTLMTLDSAQGYEVKLKLSLVGNDVLRNYVEP